MNIGYFHAREIWLTDDVSAVSGQFQPLQAHRGEAYCHDHHAG